MGVRPIQKGKPLAQSRQSVAPGTVSSLTWEVPFISLLCVSVCVSWYIYSDPGPLICAGDGDPVSPTLSRRSPRRRFPFIPTQHRRMLTKVMPSQTHSRYHQTPAQKTLDVIVIWSFKEGICDSL